MYQPLMEAWLRQPARSDKGHPHTYLPVYEALFASRRNRLVTLVEVGVAQGHSLRLWRKYFTHPDSRIVGIEIREDEWFAEDGIEVVTGDATTEAVWRPADIIIDDGSHQLEDVVAVFRIALDYLTLGGIIVVEDIQNDAYVDALRGLAPVTVIDRRSLPGACPDDRMVVYGW